MADITRAQLIEAMADAIGAAEGSPNIDRPHDLTTARYVLAAIESLGLAIVPVEPTFAFYWKAAAKHYHKHGSELIPLDKGAVDFWRAMLAASPLSKDVEDGDV